MEGTAAATPAALKIKSYNASESTEIFRATAPALGRGLRDDLVWSVPTREEQRDIPTVFPEGPGKEAVSGVPVFPGPGVVTDTQ